MLVAFLGVIDDLKKEGVIDDLKKEKAELCRRNKELLESNISMRQTISQLNQTNKQLEEEKSSLVTAVKIIQNDFNQLSAANKASSKVREEVHVVVIMRMRGKSQSLNIEASCQHYPRTVVKVINLKLMA